MSQELTEETVFENTWRCENCDKNVTIREDLELLENIHTCIDCNSFMWLLEYKIRSN